MTINSFSQNPDKEEAALVLQAAFRAYLAQNVSLPPHLVQLAKEKIEQANSKPWGGWDVSDRAPSGYNEVYMPKTPPLVFKLLKNKAIDRLQKINMARRAVRQLGLKHIFVPRAFEHKGVLVEERFAVHSCLQKYQISLYFENQDKFRSVIQELCILLSEFKLSDLACSKNRQILNYTVPNQYDFSIMRTDNMPICIKQEQGFIGLIDLETFGKHSDSDSMTKRVENAVEVVIGFFPFQLPEILEIGVQKCPEIFKDRKMELQKLSREGVELFHHIYTLHRVFLEENNVDFSDPNKFVALTEERLNKLKSFIQEKVEDQAPQFFELLKRSNFSVDQFLSELFPEILETFFSWIQKEIDENGTGPVTDACELLLRRTLLTLDVGLFELQYELPKFYEWYKNTTQKAKQYGMTRDLIPFLFSALTAVGIFERHFKGPSKENGLFL